MKSNLNAGPALRRRRHPVQSAGIETPDNRFHVSATSAAISGARAGASESHSHNKVCMNLAARAALSPLSQPGRFDAAGIGKDVSFL